MRVFAALRGVAGVAGVAEELSQQNASVIRVALLGLPNAGKSTLINNLIDRKICAASSKVHTTKSMSRAICVSGNTQMIFLDTPGIVNKREIKKYNLQQTVSAAKSSLKNADIVGVIHDISNPYYRNSLHSSIIELLKEYNTIPSFLVLNKIDILRSKRVLLDLVRVLCNNKIAGRPVSKDTKMIDDDTSVRGYGGFSDAFMISALEMDGTETIKEYLIKNAKPGLWLYPERYWTDQKPETLILEQVRAKLLDFLPQEVPYGLIPEMEIYEEHPDKIVSCVVVYCPTERIVKLISGAGGGKLHQISHSIRDDLVNMFRKSVSFTISLKVMNKK